MTQTTKTTATNNAAATVNQAAAQTAQGSINKNLEKIKKLIKSFPGLVAKEIGRIENVGSMNAAEAQEAVTGFFNTVAENAQSCADDTLAAAVEASDVADRIKSYEDLAATFKELGTEFSAAEGAKEHVQKAAKIVGVFFLTMAKALIKGAKKAAMWIAVTGVRIVCVAAGFIIKLVRAVVKESKKLFAFGKCVYKAHKEAKASADEDDDFFTAEDLDEDDIAVEG